MSDAQVQAQSIGPNAEEEAKGVSENVVGQFSASIQQIYALNKLLPKGFMIEAVDNLD